MQVKTHISKPASYSSADMAGRPATKPAPPFGERLAALRKERGWTQPQLAERLGTTVTMVTYLERRAKNPTVKTMEQIAGIFGVPVTDLLGLAEIQKNARKPGPRSQLEELTEQLSRLPRGQQKVVVQMLEGFLQKTAKA
jgi:transcriptional regulator with XRE-family HTH domain